MQILQTVELGVLVQGDGYEGRVSAGLVHESEEVGEGDIGDSGGAGHPDEGMRQQMGLHEPTTEV